MVPAHWLPAKTGRLMLDWPRQIDCSINDGLDQWQRLGALPFIAALVSELPDRAAGEQHTNVVSFGYKCVQASFEKLFCFLAANYFAVVFLMNFFFFCQCQRIPSVENESKSPITYKSLHFLLSPPPPPSPIHLLPSPVVPKLNFHTFVRIGGAGCCVK